MVSAVSATVVIEEEGQPRLIVSPSITRAAISTTEQATPLWGFMRAELRC